MARKKLYMLTIPIWIIADDEESAIERVKREISTQSYFGYKFSFGSVKPRKNKDVTVVRKSNKK